MGFLSKLIRKSCFPNRSWAYVLPVAMGWRRELAPTGANCVCCCLVVIFPSPWCPLHAQAVCILACPVKILGLETSFNLIQIHQPIMLIAISFDLLTLSLQKLGDGRAGASGVVCPTKTRDAVCDAAFDHPSYCSKKISPQIYLPVKYPGQSLACLEPQSASESHAR